MVKKILMSLAALMVMTICTYAQTKNGDKFNYSNVIYETINVNESQKIAKVRVIKPTNGVYSASYLKIPAKFAYNGWQFQVVSYASDAFAGCSAKEIEFDTSLSFNTVSKNTFKGCTNLTTITLPGSIIYINASAFEGCTALTTINLNSTISTIDSRAFANCSSLTSVPTSKMEITEISDSAFAGCKSLKSFQCPYTVEAIGAYAFAGCSNMTSFDIGIYTTSIGNSAFWSCSNLKTIYCYAANPPTCGSFIFGLVSSSRDIHILQGTKIIYENKSFWKNHNLIEDQSIQGTVPCATPVVTIKNNKLTMTCSTKGATCWYFIKPKTESVLKSMSSGSTATMNYPTSVVLTCLATCNGYTASDTVTKTISLDDIVKGNGDLDGNGVLNVNDITALINKVLGK